MLTKTPEEIQLMREGGKILSSALKAAVQTVRPGVLLREIDSAAEKVLLDAGAKPSFKGYKTSKESIPFPSTTCISINHEIVHGIGIRDIELKEGDIVGIDIGCWYKGLTTDMAVTVPVGEVSKEVQELLKVTRQALQIGIDAAQVDGSIADIGKAIEEYVEPYGFGVVRSLVGHGVGHDVHEPPSIPNYYEPRVSNTKIEEGMCLALEPMLGLGSYEVTTADDGWAVELSDGKYGGHFEVTIACTKEGPEILTPFVV